MLDVSNYLHLNYVVEWLYINGDGYECVGFCSLVALLMEMKFLSGDGNSSS